ncbi:MAG: sigma-70 family RNA polymerase sigma factor [Dysgonamonadaceae bacterium]|jgi:RNA polymerase sigma factor (sigma-70 family)|nr:sigma-70 family RNA polymerase sigma factor [Dysgonamonadaceae bacterium]
MVENKRRKNLEKQITAYQPKLRSFIRGRVSNDEDVEDILQDVFYQLIKTVDAAINPIENLSGWLFRVARNTIINLKKKKKEEGMPYYQGDDGEFVQDLSEILLKENSTPESEYLRSLIWKELENALAELPPEQRSVFELTEFEDIPVKEIAKTSGVPVATLLSRKHYAVLHLRKRLKNLYEDMVFS